MSDASGEVNRLNTTIPERLDPNYPLTNFDTSKESGSTEPNAIEERIKEIAIRLSKEKANPLAAQQIIEKFSQAKPDQDVISEVAHSRICGNPETQEKI